MRERKYIDKTESPDFIRKLNDAQIQELCKEIREVLIDTVSHTGGHLASNLGVVELTVALHKNFNSPSDKIVWDVGHQCYTHKLLTGRYEQFSTLRTEDGLSGFVRPDESEHDSFYAGHSSTSVSAALGVAQANTIKGDPSYTVAVVGDGSFTGGMIYEALNNAGRTNSRLIVILNDNEMSISQNVGSMSNYLTRIRTNPKYHHIKEKTESFLNRIPLIGNKLAVAIFRLKTAVKNIVYQSTWFEEIGLRYLGPVDGHDMKQLCSVIDIAKMYNGPVLIHVKTVKGKGYDPAERSPSTFHGISRFDVNSGEPISSEMTFSKMFGSYMCEYASKDNGVCAITAAMSLGTGLDDFSKRYPTRFFDVGIAEEHAMTFSSGLSKGGMKPVFAVYSTFLQRCYDQILHDGALQRQRLVIAIDRAGFVGSDGETHQGIYDVAFMNSIPDITVYAPALYEELNGALSKALYENDGVTAIRYPRGGEPVFPQDFKPSGGTYDVYGDTDADIAVVSYGIISANACRACNELSGYGIKTKVIKLNRIKPVDEAVVEILLKCKKIFFFEEGVKTAGVGEKIACVLLEKGYGGSFKLVAVNDCFVPHASVPSLMEKYGLTAEKMTETIKGECNG